MEEFNKIAAQLQEASNKFLLSRLEKGEISRKEYRRLKARYTFLKDQPKKVWSNKKLLAFVSLGVFLSIGSTTYGVLMLSNQH